MERGDKMLEAIMGRDKLKLCEDTGRLVVVLEQYLLLTGESVTASENIKTIT